MKRLIVFVIFLGFVTSVQAGSSMFTCRNRDGTFILDRTKLVLLETDKITKQPDLIVLNNLAGNSWLEKGAIIEFESEFKDGKKIAELKISYMSSRKEIASDDGVVCKGGHGPGFFTEEYLASGYFTMYAEQPKMVILSCVESAYWGGTCYFGGE